MDGIEIVDKIKETKSITKEELAYILATGDEEVIAYLSGQARKVSRQIYGNDIYIRGLIEFTNYCKNNCYYCGIRCENKNASRYRLSEEDILDCCALGYELGFRTFVLQGGEDSFYSDDMICHIVAQVKEIHPDCAVTLSIGEKSRESYERYFKAGADRYLLRHETADGEHYKKIHPDEMSFENRIRCLRDLKNIGYQTGCGFMVGSPFQTVDTLYKDLCFIKELQPEMVGIGPFIPQSDTPFREYAAGTVGMTLRLLSIIRLIHPSALLPATTALGTIDPRGREKGILAGANVVMPNLSPTSVRDKYLLYDNKICTGEEAAECVKCLARRLARIGYRIAITRGDYPEKSR